MYFAQERLTWAVGLGKTLLVPRESPLLGSEDVTVFSGLVNRTQYFSVLGYSKEPGVKKFKLSFTFTRNP